MDLIDFCYETLGTSVTSSCTSNDDYPASNLISNDICLRSRGFLADYFIKPPITLAFKFRHCIFLYGIEFETQVGQQFCDIFQIFASTEESSESVRIGGGSADDASKKIRFRNFYFPGHPYRAVEDSATFRLSPNQVLRSVSSLEVRILRAQKSGIPCMKNIKILAVPSCCVSKEETRTSYNIWQKTRVGHPAGPPDPPLLVAHPEPEIEVRTESNVAESETSNFDELPLDFLDALTHARMDIPMVLPCGQVIDKQTLDKYNEQEATWGRSPNDPFTGKLFSSTSRPIFDAQLKSRIDSFVLSKHGISASGLKKKRLEMLNHRDPNPPPAFTAKVRIVDDSTFSEESSKEKSIDDIISETLSGRKSIILHRTPMSGQVACSGCKKKDQLYQFSCRHFVCKSCLDATNKTSAKNFCAICNKPWERKDEIKFHSVNVS